MLGRIEVEDLGYLGVADSGVAVRSVFYGCDGRDASGSGEESGAEIFYSIADGSDATQAGDDDTIHSVFLVIPSPVITQAG
jgi:hypothetical protein